MTKQIIPHSKFGRWTILCDLGTANNRGRWLCQCECGTTRAVLAQSLRNGKSVSCGCYQREWVKKNRTTHGASKTSEWGIWNMMIQRCYNPNTLHYHRYGGRGITICEEWRHDFAKFLADMGHRPSTQHSIERKNNDEGYSPTNCRWATKHEQSRNKSDNRLLTANGETLCITDWAHRLGVNASVIAYRLKHGCSVEEAVSLPPARGTAPLNKRRKVNL